MTRLKAHYQEKVSLQGPKTEITETREGVYETLCPQHVCHIVCGFPKQSNIGRDSQSSLSQISTESCQELIRSSIL